MLFAQLLRKLRTQPRSERLAVIAVVVIASGLVGSYIVYAQPLVAHRPAATGSPATSPSPLTPTDNTTQTPGPPGVATEPSSLSATPGPSHRPPKPRVVAHNGYTNPFRDAYIASQNRIDQGVDLAGSGPVYAVGPGKIVDIRTPAEAGWDGGWWINEQLSSGPAAGKYVFVAEDCTPRVTPGQRVTTSTVVCQMYQGHTGIETGWAYGPDSGDIARGHFEYGEGLATSFGQNYSQLLASLGGPPGNLGKSSRVSRAALPPGWPRW